jgi:ferredoxin
LHTKDGRLFKANMVIISIGERPDLSYILREWLDERDMAAVDGCGQFIQAPRIFAIGDTIKPGLLTHAIGHGREVAEYIDSYLAGKKLVAKKKPPMIPQEGLSKELFRPHNRSRFNFTDPTRETNRCLSCGTCRDCGRCVEVCPEGAIRREEKKDGDFEYISDDEYCIGCGICAGICPSGIWGMEQTI